MHGKGPERHWVAETRRAVLWGLSIPVAALGAGMVHPAGFLLLALWPLQMLRLALRWRDPAAAVFSVLGKVPEALGVLGYWLGRVTGRKRGLIEYK